MSAENPLQREAALLRRADVAAYLTHAQSRHTTEAFAAIVDWTLAQNPDFTPTTNSHNVPAQLGAIAVPTSGALVAPVESFPGFDVANQEPTNWRIMASHFYKDNHNKEIVCQVSSHQSKHNE